MWADSATLHLTSNMAKGKPFIKWVGGKGQLIEQLEALLPAAFDAWQDVTYIEPFVGGGAMLFHMLQTHSNIKSAVINDINPDLTTCYTVVRDKPTDLLDVLSELQTRYHALPDDEARKEYFLNMRARYNTRALADVELSALFLFLNRTCFNGLYRVNKSGLFNVPFGKYASPTICDRQTILADSHLLQNVEILTGDFEQTFDKMGERTLFYFDPPYRPLSATSSFQNYAKEGFNDPEQIRLKKFCDRIAEAGGSFMLSNSDCLAKDGQDRFFDELYENYEIQRVWASRSVSANASKRGKLTEILVRNFGNATGPFIAAEPEMI